jgi:UDP-hydrolysing UDP-N-acetyl-D-glucosamine 2-epimerase
VTKLSHIHFPATKLAAQNVIRMGEDPATVHCTGCPSIDLLANLDLAMPKDIFHRYRGVGAELDPGKPYLVVLQHPVTTEYGHGLAQINETLKAVMSFDVQTVWLWPNVDAGSDDVSKGLRTYREHNPHARIHFYRNFSAEDYARLIHNAACLVGNSSSAIREGLFLGVPAVNIGTRQIGREQGTNVVHAGYHAGDIVAAIRKQMDHGRYERSNLFGDGKAGRRIADLLATADIRIQKKLAY